MALILHSHPQYGGTMNNPSSTSCITATTSSAAPWCVSISAGSGAARARSTTARRAFGRRRVLDWMSTLYPNPSYCWVAGISFGAWIGMQLLMRRPEITGFVSIAPQANLYDFAFSRLARRRDCSCTERRDQVVPEADVQKLVDRLSAQKGIKITYVKIDGANHFFDNHQAEVLDWSKNT
jgi:alpha/beta superfamily hydrolase